MGGSSPKTILVVDDDPGFVKWVSASLEANGFRRVPGEAPRQGQHGHWPCPWEEGLCSFSFFNTVGMHGDHHMSFCTFSLGSLGGTMKLCMGPSHLATAA